ncbi:MAG: hypothetical protein HZA35_04060 [Parcubacteria group bacterium]|nr:hypothetical protein [Parcubacteria group bacterium]
MNYHYKRIFIFLLLVFGAVGIFFLQGTSVRAVSDPCLNPASQSCIQKGAICGDGSVCSNGYSCIALKLGRPVFAGQQQSSNYTCVPPATSNDQICENGSVCGVGTTCVTVVRICPPNTRCASSTQPAYQCNKIAGSSSVGVTTGTTSAINSTPDGLKKKLIEKFGSPYLCTSKILSETERLGLVTLTPLGDAYSFRISALKNNSVSGWLNTVRVIRGLITKAAVITTKSDRQITAFCSLKKTDFSSTGGGGSNCVDVTYCGVDGVTHVTNPCATSKKAEIAKAYDGACRETQSACSQGYHIEKQPSQECPPGVFCKPSNPNPICVPDVASSGADACSDPTSQSCIRIGNGLSKTCFDGSTCGEGLVCRTNRDVQPVDCPAGARCFNPGQYSCVSPTLPVAAICGNGAVCGVNQECRDLGTGANPGPGLPRGHNYKCINKGAPVYLPM